MEANERRREPGKVQAIRHPVPKVGAQKNAARKKVAGAFVCERCQVVQYGGKWHWGAPPVANLTYGLCPACVRARDHDPAGTLRIPRTRIQDEAELRTFIDHVAAGEREEHPLERVMKVESDERGLYVETTGVHMARRLASKLARVVDEKPEFHYLDNDQGVNIAWPQ